MKKWSRWQDWANVVIGVCLIFVPFLGQVSGAAVLVTPVLGAFVVLVALWALAEPGSCPAEWSNFVLGLALFIAPSAFGYAALNGAGWSTWIAGLAVAALSLWALAPAVLGVSTSPSEDMSDQKHSERRVVGAAAAGTPSDPGKVNESPARESGVPAKDTVPQAAAASPERTWYGEHPSPDAWRGHRTRRLDSSLRPRPPIGWLSSERLGDEGPDDSAPSSQVEAHPEPLLVGDFSPEHLMKVRRWVESLQGGLGFGIAVSITEDDIVVVSLTGNAEELTAERLDYLLADLLGQDPLRVVVDLSETASVDWTVIRSLVMAARRGRDPLGVVCTDDFLIETFHQAGFGRVGSLFSSLATALWIMSPTPSPLTEKAVATQ